MPQPLFKSVLSMDIGKKRVGLAGCDPLGITITRLKPLIRNNFDQEIRILMTYCEERKVQGLIIGLPLSKEGLATKQSKYCAKYGERVATSLELPVAWVNEHSSSWAAANEFNLHNDRSGKLDSAVAELLLSQWLKEGPELKPVKMPSFPTRQLNCDTGS